MFPRIESAKIKEIYSLKDLGYNNARIGRNLGLSRERIRQLLNSYDENGDPRAPELSTDEDLTTIDEKNTIEA